jgi:hypothetical protein
MPTGRRQQQQEYCDEAAVDLIARLQLPRDTDSPSLRIVAVSDLDLPSASALAEYALTHSNISGGQVDLLIACGPFCRDDDLTPYLTRGTARTHSQHTTRAAHASVVASLLSPSQQQQQQQRSTPPIRQRTPELTAALEGIMTGALSQLEAIVCRVCFCPAGPDDPETTLKIPDGEDGPLRLTPNSRNIHGEWLPLAPALGCAGLSVHAHETFQQFR